jgi:hypothetical protein
MEDGTVVIEKSVISKEHRTNFYIILFIGYLPFAGKAHDN